jgi:hypothetical protein
LFYFKKTDLARKVFIFFKEIFNLNEELKTVIKKLKNFIPKYEKNIKIVFDKETLYRIDTLIINYYKISKFIHLVFKAVLVLQHNDKDVDLANKLEDLAYQSFEKVYFQRGLYENIR